MSRRLKVLVACEESQAVAKEFRKLGHEAYSCDLLPCSGGHPEWHLQQDVLKLLKQKWDIVIAFPPCTDLAVSGARWFKEKQADGRQQKSIDFFLNFTKIKAKHWAIENPVGIMSSRYKRPTQIIQPYEFGDPFEKTTCLWLHNLPDLVPTKRVPVPARQQLKSGKSLPTWYSNAPMKHRAKIRSKTFPGIAKAMAKQWSTFVINQDKRS